MALLAASVTVAAMVVFSVVFELDLPAAELGDQRVEGRLHRQPTGSAGFMGKQLGGLDPAPGLRALCSPAAQATLVVLCLTRLSQELLLSVHRQAPAQL